MYLNWSCFVIRIFHFSLQLGEAVLRLGAQPKVFGPLAHLRHMQPRLLAERDDVVLGEEAERGARGEGLLEEARVLGKEPALHRLLIGHDASRPSYSARAPKKSAPWARPTDVAAGHARPLAPERLLTFWSNWRASRRARPR